MLLGLAARVELGRWLEYGEWFSHSPGFDLRHDIAGSLMLAVVLGAFPVWIWCVVAGWRRAAMNRIFWAQMLAYPGIWVIAVYWTAFDPTGYGVWWLD